MPTWHWTRWERLTRDGLHDLARLRQQVFVVEQACAYLDLDGRDPLAWHLLGRSPDGALLACLRAFAPGRLRDEAVIGRVVVAPAVRRTGLGRALMEQAHRQIAHTWGPVPIHLGAQARLEAFYAGLGYVPCGPPYDEDGILHLPMRRPAPAP